MSTNKLSHLKEWDKIYLEVTRTGSDDPWLSFDFWWKFSTYITDNDTFYTLDDLKQLTNDGMPNDNIPKQGEMIYVRDYEWYWDRRIFVSFYKWKVVAVNEFDSVNIWDEWRYPPKKTELTLAEVEERLGLDAWSLIIK